MNTSRSVFCSSSSVRQECSGDTVSFVSSRPSSAAQPATCCGAPGSRRQPAGGDRRPGRGAVAAGLAYTIWSILVTSSGLVPGGALGAAIAAGLGLGSSLVWIFAIVLGAPGAIVVWRLRDEVVIVVTAIAGAAILATGLKTWLGADTIQSTLWTVIFLVLALIGIAWQWKRYRHLNLLGFGGKAGKPEPAPTKAAAPVAATTPAAAAPAAAAPVAGAAVVAAATTDAGAPAAAPAAAAPVAGAAVVAAAATDAGALPGLLHPPLPLLLWLASSAQGSWLLRQLTPKPPLLLLLVAAAPVAVASAVDLDAAATDAKANHRRCC